MLPYFNFPPRFSKLFQMCSLSWKEFLESAEEFMKVSETFQDGWNFIEKNKDEGNAYLVFRQKIKVFFDDWDTEEECVDLQNELNDSATAQFETNKEELVDIEYHVVYSISYQVPVLYFKGNRSHGRSLGLDDAWRIFRNPAGDGFSREDMLSTLTQSDHPVLFKPFLGLHPCRTAELLSQMGTSRNIILTFLSLMGPYVRLNLRNEYGLAFK